MPTGFPSCPNLLWRTTNTYDARGRHPAAVILRHPHINIDGRDIWLFIPLHLEGRLERKDLEKAAN